MDNRISTLVSAIGNLRDHAVTLDEIREVRDALNGIFLPDAKCVNFLYSLNTDKLPFGCVVFPVMDNNQVNNFLIVGEPIRFDEYEIEIDSKMFDYGLTDEQVAAIMVYNIYHLIKDFVPGNTLREEIDAYFAVESTQLIIRNSVQYQALLTLGCVDALNQLVNCLNLPDEVVSDPFLEDVGLEEEFKAGIEKLYKEIPGCENEVERQPKLSMLAWALRLYNNVDTERIPAIHILNRAKELTASALYQIKFDVAINALNRIDTDYMVESAIQQVFTEAKRKGGLLAQLKYNGLRTIEEDLYEFKIRAKNAETEQDVMYALKQINARLAILDDYIREYPDDPEIDRWIGVKEQYIEIRDQLAKTKLHKRSYGVFIDYDALDKDDESVNEGFFNNNKEKKDEKISIDSDKLIKISKEVKNKIKNNSFKKIVHINDTASNPNKYTPTVFVVGYIDKYDPDVIASLDFSVIESECNKFEKDLKDSLISNGLSVRSVNIGSSDILVAF